MNNKKILLSAFALVIGASYAWADVTLPPYFSDNMVVQQNSDLLIKGKSNKKKGNVTVKPSWTSSDYKTKINSDGSFSLTIPTPGAGGPYTLTISDGNKKVFNNVMAGEVWVCSGQSNMEMPVKGWGQVKDFEKELAEANHPDIRLFQVKRVISPTPKDAMDLEINGDGWAVSSPESVENFSSVAYFFARALNQNLNVPIGVIDTSWGGTPCEAWTSIPTLQNVVDIDADAAEIAACGGDMDLLRKKHEKDMAKWQKDKDDADPGMRDGVAFWAQSPQQGWNVMNLPGPIEYNGMPNYDGSVWFQKIVNIPQSWAGKDLILNVGKIDDEDITWFNGTPVGSGRDYWAQRTYTVPANLVKAGDNLIAIKVQDNSGTGGICGDASDLSISNGTETISLAGPWNYHEGTPLSKQPRRPETPECQNYPANLYNAMIFPLKDFPVKGAIWYQGEANVDRWEQYTPLFQAMITDWRDTWNNDLPFYFVQLANFLERNEVQPGSTWAHLREAQANALQLENTGMATAIDIGEAYDIHPKNKQEVGARLAKAALADTYGKGKYKMPAMKSMQVKGGDVVITLDEDVAVRGDGKPSFVVCGADMVFHPADVKVEKNVITLSSPEVKHPVAARYGWADNPLCNIYNKDGLPLPPFRTDSYR